MRKFTLILITLLLTVIIQSCENSENDENNEITVSISDFTTNIDENPNEGQSLGTVLAITNQGNLNYSITEQHPNQSIEINSSTGEITVLKESLFDYEVNPIISGIIKVENSGVSDTANMTINLNDVNEIVDEFNLLAVSDLGEVYEIGNNTGNINKTGQINRENDGSILSTNNLLVSSEKIYAIEYIYNPSPTNNLLIFDKQSNTTEVIPLTLPTNISGDERAIIALAWDNNNLIGVLAENVLIENSTKHIVNINLQDKSIIDVGISFNEDSISSMKKINSILYLTTLREGFLEINLNNKTVNEIKFNNNSVNGSRMAVINDSKIAIMQFISSANGVKTIEINLTNKDIIDKSNNETYNLVNPFGNSIYRNKIYFNFLRKDSSFGILKSNYETNEKSMVEINADNINTNMIIIDTME